MRARSVLPALALACLGTLPGAAAERLTILHTNDVHGHLRPFRYPSVAERDGRLADLPAWKDVGGIARRATLAARIRAEQAKRNTPVWLVDAGDFHFYSPFSLESRGLADVIAMNRAGYDLATFGNHEFEDSAADLRRLVAAATFEFVCANVTDSSTGRPLAKPYVVRAVGEARIGVFGLVTGSAGVKSAARGGLGVEDGRRVAPAIVARLRGAEKADLVVLVSHLGVDADRRLAREVPGIDVIVGGHSHTRLPQGEVVERTDALETDEVGGTILVQAHQRGGELGRLDLLLDRDAAGRWRVVRHRARLIPVTGETPDDPAVAAVLDSLWAPHAAKYAEPVATATGDFGDRGDDSPQVHLIADAVRSGIGAEVAFEPPGGVHHPILEGPVTRASLSDLDVRPYTILTFRMKGAELRRFVEKVRPFGSGLRYRVEFGKLVDIRVGGAPLDDARVYSCASNSALADQLDGFEAVGRRDTGRRWSEVVREALRKAGTITPAYDGRRVIVETLRSRSR